MQTRKAFELPAREITEPGLYLRRRDFLRDAALATLAAGLVPGIACAADAPSGERIPNLVPGPFGTDETPTSFDDATSYNNFYEFGTDKSDPKRYAHTLRTKPWSVAIEGEVGKPGVIGVKVGDDDPLDRPATEAIVDDPEPSLTRVIDCHAGVDQGPAVAIFQQPQIDVIEAERQRHAQPK